MASVGTFGKIIGTIGVLIMLVTSILLWVYGVKIRDDKPIDNKANAGKTLIGFGVMNIVFGLFMLLVLFKGCKEYSDVSVN